MKRCSILLNFGSWTSSQTYQTKTINGLSLRTQKYCEIYLLFILVIHLFIYYFWPFRGSVDFSFSLKYRDLTFDTMQNSMNSAKVLRHTFQVSASSQQFTLLILPLCVLTTPALNHLHLSCPARFLTWGLENSCPSLWFW